MEYIHTPYWRLQNNCSSSDRFITVQCRIFALSVLFLKFTTSSNLQRWKTNRLKRSLVVQLFCIRQYIHFVDCVWSYYVTVTCGHGRRVPVQTTERLFRESVPLLRDMVFVGVGSSEHMKSNQDKILVRYVGGSVYVYAVCTSVVSCLWIDWKIVSISMRHYCGMYMVVYVGMCGVCI